MNIRLSQRVRIIVIDEESEELIGIVGRVNWIVSRSLILGAGSNYPATALRLRL